MSVDSKTKSLPRNLRADVLVRTPLACRFGWHHVVWEEQKHDQQYGQCVRCNKAKRRVLW